MEHGARTRTRTRTRGTTGRCAGAIARAMSGHAPATALGRVRATQGRESRRTRPPRKNAGASPAFCIDREAQTRRADVCHFICTEPFTLTVTVVLPPSTAIGALIFALSIAGAAIANIRGYGCTLRPLPTFTSRIE